MKVLHLNNYDYKGGAETVFNITRNNNLTSNFSGFVKLDQSTPQPDITFLSWEFQNKILGTINYIFSIHNYQSLKYFLENNDIDVIHIHGFFASISPSILLAIKRTKSKKKIKVFQTLHDFHLICPNASLYNYKRNEICEKCIGKKYKFAIFTNKCDRRGWVHSIIKGIRSLLANNIIDHKSIVDKFICPSNFLKSKLIEEGIEEKKISVIRNPITLTLAEIPKKKENIICYFGRFSREKNLTFLIDTFNEWKKQTNNNFRLLLIGEGEEETKLKDLAQSSAYRHDIIFKSYMTQDNLLEEIKYAKYFCLTSTWYENSPMSIIEAFSSNIIPIVPDKGGMYEIIKLLNLDYIYIYKSKTSFIKVINKIEQNYSNQIKLLEMQKEKTLYLFNYNNYYTYLFSIYNMAS